ncbi:STRN protein, partial [Atractosteus spatula]|nr:STRN protein [Atractosteus spatula]
CQPSANRALLPGLAMEEQAGPGVFFNNNYNSVLPGGGKGPQPEGGGGEAARAQYSIPGILHFLQHEWARFEVERAQWEVERAELQLPWQPGESERGRGWHSHGCRLLEFTPGHDPAEPRCAIKQNEFLSPLYVSTLEGLPFQIAQFDSSAVGKPAQIAFLQGERKGQENLKKDLVRRIKMLEYALKQERAKYHKLKYGTELNQGDMKPPSYDSDEGNEKDNEVQAPLNNQISWKQGRQLLRQTSSSFLNFTVWKLQSREDRALLISTQYLQEVGYTDTILDVKSQRVKALLGLAGDAGEKPPDKNPEPMVNGTEPSLKGSIMTGKPDLTDSASVLEAFKFIESAAAEFSDEDEDDDSDGKDKTIIDSSTIVRKKVSASPSSSSDISDDLDTEEALKGFDFLGGSDEADNSVESRSAGDGTDWEKDEQCPMPEAWDVDQGLITKLKEQYKKERKGKKGVKIQFLSPLPPPSQLGPKHCGLQRAGGGVPFCTRSLSSGCVALPWPVSPVREGGPNRSKLQDMLANLRDVEDLPPMQPSVTPPARPSIPRLNEHEPNHADEVEAMTFPPTSGKSFIMGTDEAMESELGLGELAGLTVANEAESLTYDITNNKDALRKTWNPKFTLRSHFDGIRGLAFHPVEPVLVTASEDHTLKMWNLQKTAPAKKSASLDVEPIYTFRAHRGSVLCVVMSTSGEQCFSGGIDGTIQSWNTPNPNIDPYDSYEPSVLRGALCGHTDAVWGLVYSAAHQRLLSCSADGTIRLWNAADTSPALSIFNENRELGIPSSVDLVCSEPAHMVSSFNSGQTGIFNMETRQLVLSLEAATDGDTPCQINKVLSHPTLPITITAQEDRHIKFFDNNTGKLIHSMVAHLDAVTSLAVDPNGLYLMSGSHDCSIRLWNLESKTCIQEFTAHRKKFDESIHDVAFHPSKCFIASAGADALAKVFV